MSLRQRLSDPRAVLAPGVFDAFTALIAEQAGFEALYLSGASIAYTRLGRPDIGLVSFSEVADVLARITERVSRPVIVDADTGFGNALNVQRTVRGFERAGAAMIQLEDQTFPKRCGHLDGKAVVPTSEMCGKLRAALDARTSADTLILARTDALAVEGLDCELLLNGEPFASGVSSQALAISPYGVGALEVAVTSTLLDVVRQVAELERSRAERFRWQLRGQVGLRGAGRLPFDSGGEVSLDSRKILKAP